MTYDVDGIHICLTIILVIMKKYVTLVLCSKAVTVHGVPGQF